MTRNAPSSRSRRPRWAVALALVPLALAACGKDDQKPIIVTQMPPAEPAKVIPTGGLPPAETPATPPVRRLETFAEAESAYHEGKYGEAKGFFAEYTTTKPDNPWGHYMLGLASIRTGDLDGAKAALEKAVELEPAHLKSHLNLARVLLDLDRNNEALERAEIAIRLDSSTTDGLRLKARAQAKLGDPEGAIATYREALVVDDEDVWSMNNLGVLYLERDQAGEALGPLARAVQIKGTAPVFQNNLGMALERAGFPVAAKEAYERAVKADSAYAKAVKNLDRLAKVVTDTTAMVGVNLEEIAEVFRLNVQMWNESRPLMARDTTVDTA